MGFCGFGGFDGYGKFIDYCVDVGYEVGFFYCVIIMVGYGNCIGFVECRNLFKICEDLFGWYCVIDMFLD